MDSEATKTLAEKFQTRFNLKLAQRVERANRTKVHKIIPGSYFSNASSECREAFLDGHFYSCIASTQSVAEAISRFVSKANNVRLKKDHLHRVDKLLKEKQITKEAVDAFKIIHKKDRNTFHHLNEDLETDAAKLESRAEECINALFSIESEIFAFDIMDGALSPRQAKYWPASRDELILVSMRQDI